MEILRFTSETCQPCKMLAKTLESMDINQNITVIDIGKNPEAIDQYNIRGVPTLIYKGEQLVGLKNAAEITAWIDKLSSK